MNIRVPTYKNHRYPIKIVGRAIWLYLRFNVNLREVEEMMLEREGYRFLRNDPSLVPKDH